MVESREIAEVKAAIPVMEQIAALKAENETLREDNKVLQTEACRAWGLLKETAERALAERAGSVRTVDDLAQEIRRVDGSNSLGAGALAEALMPFLSCLTTEPAAPEGQQEAGRIGDAVLDWMVKFDLLDAGNEYYVSDVLAVLNDLTPSTRPAEQAVTEAEHE